MADRQAPEPISPAFAKRLFRTWLVFAAVAVAGFGWIHHRFHNELDHRAALAQAELASAALAPGSDAELAESAMRLLSRSDQLVAIGILSSTGQVDRVFPQRPGFQEALNRGAAAILGRDFGESASVSSRRVRIPSPTDDAPMDVAAAVVPLFDSQAHTLRRVCVVSRANTVGSAHTEASALLAVILGAVGAAAFLSLRGWFDRRIALPLRSIAQAAAKRSIDGERYVCTTLGDWHETKELASHFQDLLRSLEETDARTKRLERDVERQLRDKEEGFKLQLRRATDRALTDPLTRLRNRAFLEENLERIFDLAKSAGQDLSAVAIDLDNFKGHNDTHGHLAGDAILRFTGVLLRGATRPSDYAVRHGGDEFIVLLPAANQQQAATIATRILKLFNQHIKGRSPRPTVSMSAGVASLRVDGCATGHELLARADAALYAAKRAGKNGVASTGAPDPKGRREHTVHHQSDPNAPAETQRADAAA